MRFPDKANGQLIERNGKIVGSRIIGQAFSSPGYFRSRPSAAGAGYDAANSAGTQLGPTNKKLIDAVDGQRRGGAARRTRQRPVPVDLVTSSASGLDPHLSPAAARFQVPRVARERGVAEAEVRRLVEAHTAGPAARIPRRAAGQRARAQSGARRAVSDERSRRRDERTTWPTVAPPRTRCWRAIKERERARLRIYIGAAPGVGKTYEMLEDAHALRASGVDVVIGFVETHGRPDTAGAARATSRSCRGARSTTAASTLEEMDVDADLRRGAAACASSTSSRTPTCPGSRHAKRYEDVLELLDAGIHVMTAVNIQHLESLNDAVAHGHRRARPRDGARLRSSSAPTR